MVAVIVVVRELGRRKPDYSLDFDLPAVPQIGSYISVNRPDHREPYSEDLIVRHVWWRLRHPETRGYASGDEAPKVGNVIEIFVECDQALGPYATDRWRKSMEAAKARGVEVEDFDVARVSVPEADLEPKK